MMQKLAEKLKQLRKTLKWTWIGFWRDMRNLDITQWIILFFSHDYGRFYASAAGLYF